MTSAQKIEEREAYLEETPDVAQFKRGRFNGGDVMGYTVKRQSQEKRQSQDRRDGSRERSRTKYQKNEISFSAYNENLSDLLKKELLERKFKQEQEHKRLLRLQSNLLNQEKNKKKMQELSKHYGAPLTKKSRNKSTAKVEDSRNSVNIQEPNRSKSQPPIAASWSFSASKMKVASMLPQVRNSSNVSRVEFLDMTGDNSFGD